MKTKKKTKSASAARLGNRQGPLPAQAAMLAKAGRHNVVSIELEAVPLVLADPEQENFNALMDAFEPMSGVKAHGRLSERVVQQLSGLLCWDGDASTTAAVNQKIRLMVEYLAEIQPTNGVQTMLAVQMIGVHEQATKSLVMASRSNDVAIQDGHVLRATRLMRLFNEQLEALAKLKGTAGQQRVIVEHVHVHSGGQAVVGVVEPARLPGGARGDESK